MPPPTTGSYRAGALLVEVELARNKSGGTSGLRLLALFGKRATPTKRARQRYRYLDLTLTSKVAEILSFQVSRRHVETWLGDYDR